MPIVGANHQAMLTGILEDPGQVIVRLTSHKDLIGLEDIVRKPLALCLIAARYLVVDPRYPLRRRFNEPPTEMREQVRHVTHQQHKTGEHSGSAKQREAIEALTARKVPQELTVGRISIGNMDGNSHVEATGLFINWVEVRVCHATLPFQGTHADRHSAVL